MAEIWVLGATGRGGRGIARELVAGGSDVVLVGRDADRLAGLAGSLTPAGPGGVRLLVASGLSQVVELISREGPSVVVNTIGPFTTTSVPVARACLGAGSHYVDLANELGPVHDLLGLHEAAIVAGITMVTGAGFGVLATEALVVELRADREPAVRARVAAMPSVEALGPAVLASFIDAIAAGVRRYRDGQLVSTRLGSDLERISLPDGRVLDAIGVPTGELEAAQRGSGAGDVIAFSSEVPSGRIIRRLLPAVSALLAKDRIRIGLQGLVSRLRLTPPARSGDTSWAYARLEWADGTQREAWLHTGEGYQFTAQVAAQVAARLLSGVHRRGAYTPAALFGSDLVRQVGGEIITQSANPLRHSSQ
ncbi:MAG: saccharopine dehydrogenase NADP-binding domain-containing protein [Pseudonocardiaceae bacterium]